MDAGQRVRFERCDRANVIHRRASQQRYRLSAPRARKRSAKVADQISEGGCDRHAEHDNAEMRLVTAAPR
jgi:hypothetical protein